MYTIWPAQGERGFNPGLMNKSNDDLMSQREGMRGSPPS